VRFTFLDRQKKKLNREKVNLTRLMDFLAL